MGCDEGQVRRATQSYEKGCRNCKGRSKLACIEIVRQDMEKLGIILEPGINRSNREMRIHKSKVTWLGQGCSLWPCLSESEG